MGELRDRPKSIRSLEAGGASAGAGRVADAQRIGRPHSGRRRSDDGSRRRPRQRLPRDLRSRKGAASQATCRRPVCNGDQCHRAMDAACEVSLIFFPEIWYTAPPSFRDAPSRQNSEAILRGRRGPGSHFAARRLDKWIPQPLRGFRNDELICPSCQSVAGRAVDR